MPFLKFKVTTGYEIGLRMTVNGTLSVNIHTRPLAGRDLLLVAGQSLPGCCDECYDHTNSRKEGTPGCGKCRRCDWRQYRENKHGPDRDSGTLKPSDKLATRCGPGNLRVPEATRKINTVAEKQECESEHRCIEYGLSGSPPQSVLRLAYSDYDALNHLDACRF